MSTYNKVLNVTDLTSQVQKVKAQNQKVVLCNGHFNVIHPGHLRFIQFAHQQGDKLLIAVEGDSALLKQAPRQRFFNQVERASSLAALQNVDLVIIIDEVSLNEVIDIVKPSVYVLGKEFEEERHEEIQQYIDCVTENNGKVVFGSGEVHYASVDFLYQDYKEIEHGKLQSFHLTCRRNQVEIDSLKNLINQFQNLNLAVIGDTIVDQYVACDALGMSAEAPVIAVQEMETKEFLGGAAIVANHLQSLGANCHFISVVGDDQPAHFLEQQLLQQGVQSSLLIDKGRPTTFKIRYMVNNQKLFRVSRLQDHSISKSLEEQIIGHLKQIGPDLDGIVVSDFVYGVVTNRLLQSIIEIAKKYNIKLFGDLQCSSQIGNVLKFKQFDLICPTEREARIALSNHESGIEKLAHELLKQTQVKNLLITLGPKGFVSYHQHDQSGVFQSQNFPALISNPVDVAGAGDALLSALSISLCSNASLMEASALGTCVAAIAVNRMGNVPLTSQELIKFLDQLTSQVELNRRNYS
jgi:rfaE bifunctional protein kinase chain/domain